jgi:glutathione S-transferase
MGEAPMLVHGTKKLSQSGVILTYLAERSGKFLPRSAREAEGSLPWRPSPAPFAAAVRRGIPRLAHRRWRISADRHRDRGAEGPPGGARPCDEIHRGRQGLRQCPACNGPGRNGALGCSAAGALAIVPQRSAGRPVRTDIP